MSWKPIPQEAPAVSEKSKSHITPRLKRQFLYVKKKNKNPKMSYRLYQSVSMRLLSYIEKEKKHSKSDVDDLINDMQKVVSSLQKKRTLLAEKKNKKKKNK